MAAPAATPAPGSVPLEDAPFRRFHTYAAVCAAGGPLIDGYVLGIIVIALAQLSPQLGLTTAEEGLVGAASLVGLFFGGLVCGRLTDRYGRKAMYTLDLLVFVVASVLQIFVGDVWQLIALRFVLGVAVGADYPIATTLLTELVPKKQRGPALASLVGAWWGGYALSFVVGWATDGMSDDVWRWTLASSAIPAVIFLVMRFGIPESPLWLARRGRTEEARKIVDATFGPEYALPPEPTGSRSGFRAIFARGYGRRTWFVSAFWVCQVAPTFAIYTFQPALLESFGVADGNLGSALISVFFLVGVIPAIKLVNSWGRRPVLLWGFAVPAVVFAVLAVVPTSMVPVAIGGFVLFAIFNAGSSVVQWIYPNELFPTDTRATAVGFGAAMSRIGAAIGTFLLPIGLEAWGVGAAMGITGAVCLLGLIVSIPLATETKDLTLSEAGSLTS